MRYILLILISIVLTNCQYPKSIIIESELDKFEPGRCHISNSQPDRNDSKTVRFTLKMVKPIFKIETKTYYLDELLSEHPDFKSIGLMTQVASLEFIISDKYYDGFTKQKFPKSYSICLIEKSALYKTIKQSDFIKNKLEIQLKTLENGPRVIKTYVKQKPKKLLNTDYYFEGKNWTELKEVVYGSH